MRSTTLVLIALAMSALASTAVSADTIRRTCLYDNGTRTCTTVIVKTRTDRIQGMPASLYIRGVRSGKCMPSPSGACGGG
jgi:hypothetical protein